MSKAKLKKHLLSLTKEQITDIVLELYDARKEAKDYLEFYLAPDCNAELEKSKKAIRNEFFPTRGFSEKPSFAKCRKVISDFQKLKPEPTTVADSISNKDANTHLNLAICGNSSIQHWREISTKLCALSFSTDC